MLVDIVPYSNDKHAKHFYDLNIEYVNWVSEKYETIHNIDLEAVNGKSNEEYVKEFLTKFTKIQPPHGLILVLVEDDEVVGMGSIVELESGIGEIKRMYIKSKFRGQSLGRTLLSRLIEQGREFGYSKLRLETADFFEAARHIYQSVGFRDIEEYQGGEVSLCLRKTTRHMEMDI